MHRILAAAAVLLLPAAAGAQPRKLDPARFVRIHRSTIVNLEKIKELQPFFRGEYVVVLHGGTTLKLSRGYRENLERRLGRAI